MINYYELLGVSQDAGRTEIEQAIKKTRRLWNNRSNSPDSGIRAEAEQHIREVAEAERTLLDDAKREAYNRQLAMSPVYEEPKPGPTVDYDWEEDYWQAYNRDINDLAEEIARKAINVNERDGRAWFLYGEAIRRGGNPEGAIGPLQRASLMLKSDPGVYRQLGFAFSDLGRNVDAMKAFNSATECDPSDGEFYALRAMLYRDSRMIDEALDQARMGYKLSPSNGSVRFEYFFALYEDAMRSMSYNRSSGKHLIINKVQLDYINGLLKEMAMTIPDDENSQKCSAAMDEVVKYVVDAESRKGGFLSAKIGYKYNFDVSNAETRATGKH